MHKSLVFACLIVILGVQQALAQSTDTFMLRAGGRLDTPHVGTYDLFEYFREKGKWIVWDMGGISYPHNSYEVFIGAGRTLHSGEKLTLVEEFYFDQDLGPAGRGARYFWPWTLVDFRFTPKLTSEVVYFPYVPLNKSARIQHVLERAKVEYALNGRWKVGAGYGGYKFAGDEWQNRPFITTTVSTRAGSMEFWLQRMPGGAQLQLRYHLARVHH